MSIDRIPVPRTDGSLWLCGLRDVAEDPEAALSYAGASTIVCLNERRELEGRAPAYLDWVRANQPGRAIWFPIRNYDAPPVEHVAPILRMIAERLERGEGVVIHCAMGQGRAGTMAVCVLLQLGATLDDALRVVASHRVFGGPGESTQWALVEAVAAAVG